MINKSKSILFGFIALIALASHSASLANPADQGKALMSEQVQEQININTASAGEIAASLKGVGLKTAEAIVAYRDTHGEFQSLDSLTMVKGVGSKTVSKNRQRIILE